MEVVAVFVAEAALSAALDALFGKISSQDLLRYARRNNVESEVQQWSKFLRKMKYVLDDAEERQMSEGPIKLWLDDLTNLAYDVEDILDEFSYEILRQKVVAQKTEASPSKVRKLIQTSCSCFSPRDIKFNVSLGSKMKEITQRFEAITKDKENLNLTERATGGSKGVVREKLETTSLVQESQVYGRENDKKTLVNELLSSDSNGNPVSVVAIVGMGGLGKTTLAQLVYNEETVSKSFDIKAWVCVSDEFDVFKITVKIIESFTSSTCDLKDLNNVQKKLKDVLHGKKFLLILDDVWNENYMQWDALTQPFMAGGLGSKVLITTRIENVATTAGAGFIHVLKKLELEECLSLLALHAFGVDTFSGKTSLQEVGKQIAKKCDGLPLAAKALGGLLRGKLNPKEWQTVLNSNMWELARDKCPVLPALRVSYHYLPSHLKRCFAFCAIFPKDYEFEKDVLIMWWMAEGLLEQSKLVLSNFTEVGNEYFKDLLSMSFFQPSTGLFKDDKFVMHDLMNDLAMWISGGICLHLNNYEASNYDMRFENLRHLSFMSRRRHDVAKKFEKFSISMGLRTFIGFNPYLGSSYLSNVILERMIPKMRCLKLLCLSHYEIKELPQSISELKHLRHLDMSLTRICLLPESICDLPNLQILNLNCCWDLVQLPGDIRKLINLRVLDISETDKLKTMPVGIGCLKNLQILLKFIVGEKQGLRLKELKGLTLIRGELSIWGLEKVVDVQEARDANLKAKEGLVSLEFKWMEETSVDKEKHVQILDELQPHTTLRSLIIDGYNGKHFPKWVGDSRFTNLETLSLNGCKSASSLPPLGGMSNLKMLNISGMPEVKRVGKEFLGNTSNSDQAFPSLETLILEEMNGLEEWCSCFGSGEEIKVVFPQLQKMEISDCPVLVGKLPNQLPLLEKLSISKCPNLRNLECKHPLLQKLVIEDCSDAALKTLRDLTSLRSLKLKNIRDLICMDDELLSMLGVLQELDIERCGEMKSLVRNDKEIEGIVGLQRLTIRYCAKVMSFGRMRLPSSLKKMEISFCEAIKWLPDGFMMDGSSTSESALEELKILECPSLTTFPTGKFPNLLVQLEIYGCKNLESIPEFSNSLKTLAINRCDHLHSLPRFPASILNLSIENLTSLVLESTSIEKGMPISSNNENIQYQSPLLKCIEIGNVENVESKSKKMFADCSISLESLDIGRLKLRRLPENITSFQRIKELKISFCENLRWLPKQIQELNCLRGLTIHMCPNLELLVGQDLPRELERLQIVDCEKMIEGLFAGGLSPLVSLTHLEIHGWTCVLNIKQEAPVFLPKLQYLSITNFGNMENLAAAFQLPSIEQLTVKKCAKLQQLPFLEFSSNLESLIIYDCPMLKKRCLDRKGEYWPLLSMIPRVDIDSEDIYSFKGSS